MNIKLPLLIYILLLFTGKAYTQSKCGCCYDSVKNMRVDIIGERLRDEPFTAIVNLFVNSTKFRGTASFISEHVLITAKHNLFENKKPKNFFFQSIQ